MDWLLDECLKLQYHLDSTGAEMACKQSLPPDWLSVRLRDFLEEFAASKGKTLKYVTINRLRSGISVPKHTDTLIGGRCFRYHYPVMTNPDCVFWTPKTGTVHMPVGHWYGPIEHWEEHSVCNLGKTDRIHIVVDLA